MNELRPKRLYIGGFEIGINADFKLEKSGMYFKKTHPAVISSSLSSSEVEGLSLVYNKEGPNFGRLYADSIGPNVKRGFLCQYNKVTLLDLQNKRHKNINREITYKEN